MDFFISCLRFFGRFHVEMWLCSTLFLFCCEKRSYFWIRYIFSSALFLSLPYLLPRAEGENIYYWSYLQIGEWINLSWILFYLLDWILLFFLFRFSIHETFFFSSASYTMQHLMKRIIFLICSIFSLPIGSGLTYYILSTSMLFPILFFDYWFFVRRMKKGQHINTNNLFIIGISVVTVFLFCFLSNYNDLYSRDNISLKITTSFTDSLILILLFGIYEQSKSKREKEEMTKMLHEKQEDMIFSKKNIDLINMKAHDLKHQLEALKSLPGREQDSHIAEIEKEIINYDLVCQSKSEPLNIVLTKKALYCQKHNIKINYMVEDEPLSFIVDVDLYTMMGNILDNAIEALLKIPEKEKRIIYLTIKKKNQFLSIHEANAFDGELKLQNGLPLTTKENKDYHGIGLKSILYLSKKYNGNMTLSEEDGIFNLDILFPITTEEKQTE